MGSEGYLINQMLAAAHQPPHRRLGRHRGQADALPRRGRTPDPRGRGRRLPDRLPDLAARPGRGRPDLGRGGRPGARARGGRRHRAQHRHRLARGAGPHDHHPGAARRLARGDRAAEGRGDGAGLRLQPDQHPRPGRGDPRRRRGRPGVDGASAPGRPRLRREGRLRSRRRDQHLHRLQPGLPRPRLRQPRASCLVNPRAGRETELVLLPLPSPVERGRDHAPTVSGLDPARPPSIAVVGAGPAGLAAAASAAERGFAVTLFEKGSEVGGQFRLAMRIPGKEEFAETLRYFSRRLEVLGARVRLSTEPTVGELAAYDDVIVATGRHAADPGPRRRRPPQRRDVRRRAGRAGRAGPSGGGGRCRGDRRRREPLPDPRPRRRPRRLDGALGRRRPGPAPGRPDRAASRGRPCAR